VALRHAADWTARLDADWKRTRARSARTFADRAAPCYACGYDLRGAPHAKRCSECGGMIDWSPGLFRDGRFHLLLALFVGASAVIVRLGALRLERLWDAHAHAVAQFGVPVNVDRLILIDVTAFLVQMGLTACALAMSLHRTRDPRHAMTRLAAVALLMAVYWVAVGPTAHRWA
jgi:hypothetical protein